MAFLDIFRRKALIASPEVLEAAQDRTLNLRQKLGVSAQVRAAWMQFQSASYGWLYGSQPAVRAVVDYIASNVAQLGPHLYERVSDTDRKRRSDHEAEEIMRNPNPWTPGKQFIFDVFGDFLVYNNAYVLKVRPSADGKLYLLPVPASAVAVLGTGVSQVAGYKVYRTDGSSFDVPAPEMIHWRGYNASDRAMGISKLETLRADLSEQAASQRANVDLMESGLQQRGYIKRPLEAADWHTSGGRDRFLQQFRAAMQKADRGYPILEEGMEIAPLGVSPKDAEMLASRKLFNEEVARQYGMTHCPPESEDERKQFYADVIPPLVNSFCDFFRLQLLQVEYMEDDMYYEFDLDEKQMSDDRLRAITSAVGAPPLTRNEGRAMLNLPAKDEGDELITPQNVTVGGKPSPGVMPVQNPLGPDQRGGARQEVVPAGGQPAGVIGAGGRSLNGGDTKANWIEQTGSGHLPEYIRRIANHLQRRGMTEGHAIAVAVNAAKRMCATGDLNFPGAQQVNPGSRAEACAAVAEWEARKVEAAASSIGQETKQLEPGNTLPRPQRDMARQRRRIAEVQDVLRKQFKRQYRSVSQKAAPKYDRQRWDNELARELKSFLLRTFALEGAAYVSYLGGEDFDMSYVENYVDVASREIAKNLNDATARDIEKYGVSEAFERAFARAENAGTGIGTRATVRARNEAARQSPNPELRRKVWIKNTDRHADLDGKTVALDESWADGLEPGQEPNCGCTEIIV